MKTTILTLATISSIVLGIGTKSFAAVKDSAAKSTAEVSTVLNNVTKINKIEVRGNVELFVSDGETDQVKVYNKYYEESALVQSQNGVLRIASYANQKLVVWIKAADLRAITAYDNAEVKSFGKLSPIELNVNLHNNASAKLDLDAFSANVTVNDHATADLSGTASQVNLKHDVTASVNKFNLKAERITENKVLPTNAKELDMATL
jgi:hypothetical protein